MSEVLTVMGHNSKVARNLKDFLLFHLSFAIIVFVFEGHEEYEEEFDCVKIFESNSDPSAIEHCSWYRSARLRNRATRLVPSCWGGRRGRRAAGRACQPWLTVEVHPAGVHPCQEHRHPHHDNPESHREENEDKVEKGERTSFQCLPLPPPAAVLCLTTSYPTFVLEKFNYMFPAGN